MNNDTNKEQEPNIETLNIQPENANETTEIKDIPTSFFKPIDEIKEQQDTLIKNYESGKEAVNPNDINLSNELAALEKKLNKKKLYIPFIYVIAIILLINVAWFVGVKFLIVPKYDEYVTQAEEIKANYDTLKRRVDALLGE